jgi:mannan endo-1,4-beta-mannosidase
MTLRDTRSAVRQSSRQKARRTTRYVTIVICALLVIGASAGLAIIRPWANKSIHPTQSVRYLGVYQPDAPHTYSSIDKFAQAIGRQPNLVSYYSPWLEPFQTRFARLAANHGAETIVQIDPKNVSLASIAAGHYDAYLRSYATAVRAFGSKVVLSFGHEMNGAWYSWGYKHTSPHVFVAAWRHVVTVFRAKGATNVDWLWTVNVLNKSIPIPAPDSWWPGSSYVDWVGIDGYYYQSSETFSQVFGPTIVDVLAFTHDPMFIAETGAAPSADQPAKINDLFAGIRTYGLTGFLWFDENTQGRAWRVSSPKAFAAFRQDTKAFMKSRTTSASPRASSS